MNDKKYFTVYKITNKINNMIYIGCHVTKNINDKYMGSGSMLKKDIKRYGIENFNKSILYVYDNEKEMLEKEKELVNEHFISKENTYNVIIGGRNFLTLNSVSVIDESGESFRIHKSHPLYISGKVYPVTKGKGVYKNDLGEIIQCDIENVPEGYYGILKNKIVVEDNKGNKMIVDKNDIRYKNGELAFILSKYHEINKNKILVEDKYGNFMMVNKNDPRYINGELKFFWENKKHSKETKIKMSRAKKGKYKKEKNSQYGTCWIYNEGLKINKKIKKENLDDWTKKGWSKGRKMKFK